MADNIDAFDDFIYVPPLIDATLNEIILSGNDLIRCSLTGYPYGRLTAEEIKICLLSIFQNNPLMNQNILLDEYYTRHALMSSGPAPSLRIHRDKNTIVNLLRSDADHGKGRLLAYMMGRLFFDAIIPTRLLDTSSNTLARVSFLTRLHGYLMTLPAKWWENDEQPETLVLEGLLRIDAIFSFRTTYSSDTHRVKLVNWLNEQDWDKFDFSGLLAVIDLIEAEGLNRLNKIDRSQLPQGNAMVISAALHILKSKTMRQALFEKNHDELTERVREATIKGRIGMGTTAEQILQNIQKILVSSELIGTTSKAEKLELAADIRQLSNEINRISFSDKRLDRMKRVNARIANMEPVIVHSGGERVKNELLRAKGIKKAPAPRKSPSPGKPLDPAKVAEFEDLFAQFSQFTGTPVKK